MLASLPLRAWPGGFLSSAFPTQPAQGRPVAPPRSLPLSEGLPSQVLWYSFPGPSVLAPLPVALPCDPSQPCPELPGPAEDVLLPEVGVVDVVVEAPPVAADLALPFDFPLDPAAEGAAPVVLDDFEALVFALEPRDAVADELGAEVVDAAPSEETDEVTSGAVDVVVPSGTAA